MVGFERKYFTVTVRPLWSAVSLKVVLSMFILYSALFTSIWFQCTMSEPKSVPVAWQREQSAFVKSLALARGPWNLWA